MQGGGEGIKHFQCWVAGATFDAADISAIKPAFLGKTFLRKPCLHAQRSNTLSQQTFDISGIFHTYSIVF
ncbi:hypothetical protein GA0061070_103710 [Kosakonia oryziphila]|uniref:Uncharacterized protein n=1 Tax=Kosakonia oryziphila TaxID=1005667 RepID=A0A1C4FJN6_9ENTR|nr:hypothetical protein GA0061070_103710 [Kosakonia oryziphila]